VKILEAPDERQAHNQRRIEVLLARHVAERILDPQLATGHGTTVEVQRHLVGEIARQVQEYRHTGFLAYPVAHQTGIAQTETQDPVDRANTGHPATIEMVLKLKSRRASRTAG